MFILILFRCIFENGNSTISYGCFEWGWVVQFRVYRVHLSFLKKTFCQICFPRLQLHSYFSNPILAMCMCCSEFTGANSKLSLHRSATCNCCIILCFHCIAILEILIQWYNTVIAIQCIVVIAVQSLFIWIEFAVSLESWIKYSFLNSTDLGNWFQRYRCLLENGSL